VLSQNIKKNANNHYTKTPIPNSPYQLFQKREPHTLGSPLTYIIIQFKPSRPTSPPLTLTIPALVTLLAALDVQQGGRAAAGAEIAQGEEAHE
jgi:hypothetical protein